MTYGQNTFVGAASDGSLTAAVQGTRVQLTLLWPGVNSVTIYRNDPDGVARPVRNTEPGIATGGLVAYDHEAPLDVPVTYTVSASQGSVLLDTFTGRTVASGWGNADSGQTYTVSTPADCNVNSGVGTIQPGATGSDRQAYANISNFEFDITGDLSVNTLPGSGTWGIGLCGRLTDGSNHYNLRFTSSTAGTMNLVLSKRVGGAGTTIQTVGLSTVYVPTTVYRMRFKHAGTSLMGKVWLPGAAEPDWIINITDAASVPPPGTNAGAFARNDGAATTHIMTYENLNSPSSTVASFTSNTVTVASGGQAWLTHPGHPKYAGIATVTRDGLTEARPARRGVFDPIGTSLPVVVNDVRGGSTGTVTVQTNSAADIARLRSMLADGAPLLLRQPASWGGDAWWISVGDVGIDRFTQIATDQWRKWALPYLRIDRPPGLSEGPVGVTWADVKSTYATWGGLTATGKTWLQLAQSVT
jgi:hypothetical protein